MSTDPQAARDSSNSCQSLENQSAAEPARNFDDDSQAKQQHEFENVRPTSPDGRNAAENSVEFVVGIGASAGGLQSIEKLLTKLKPGTHSALVIVQHFSPDVVSSMAAILTRSTDLKVLMATNGAPLQPDTIFLIPPGQEIRIVKNEFRLNEVDRSKVTRVVDALLISLAESQGSKSIGVILSGTGSDGSNGIKAIRKAGGATLVESFDTAQFDGMPKNAVLTQCVDVVLSAENMAEWLNTQFANPLERPVLEDTIAPEELTGIQLIFSLLTQRHEVDFSVYKPSTVCRRIERRQQICKQKTIQEYAYFTRDNQEELDLLYHDLLIGVTKFFRDTDAFLALERHLTELINNIPPGEQLRIWSAGCATGEEPYSLAMLAHDTFERLGRTPNYKVFATDIHQRCLDFASRGIYDNETMENVSRERQAKFFTQESETHSRVTNLLRKNMVFARQNVFKDPSFTNMHLVTCRNLLIYLKPQPQMRAISSFHFAMRVDGLMMLGSSETVGSLAEEFRHIDKEWRIFQKIQNRPNLSSQLLHDTQEAPKSGPRQLVNMLNRDRPEAMSFTRLIECYDAILKEYVPSGLLLDENRNILHVFGDANKYLNSKSGRFSGNLSGFLDGEAKIAITAALIQSQQKVGKKILLENLKLRVGEAIEDKSICVCAFHGIGAGTSITWLVEFMSQDASSDSNDFPVNSSVEKRAGNYAELESELVYTKDSLNISIEQLESSNQELSAANEELVASNEELQSTNEELESVNEELYTVNLENNRRIDDLNEVTDDLEVLLSTCEIGTLFLDAKLCVRKFTRSIHGYFNLLAHDVGRPIGDFANKSGIVDLNEKLKFVLSTGHELIDDATDRDGNQIQFKIVPHLLDDEIAGVILTLSGQPSSRNNKAGFWRWPNVNQDEMWWSPECCELLGFEPEFADHTFSTWKSLVHPDDVFKLASAGTKTLRVCSRRVLNRSPEMQRWQISPV